MKLLRSTGITGRWPLSSSQASGTSIYDTGRNGHDAVSANSPTFGTGPDGVSDSAQVFNGTTDFDRISNYDPTGDNGKFLSAFCCVKGVSQNGKYFFSHYDSGTNQRSLSLSFIESSESKLRVILSDDGTFDAGHRKQYTSSIIVGDNEWHHVGFIWNAGTLKLYIDGVWDENVTKTNDDAITTLHPSTADLTIGSVLVSDNTQEPFTGSVSNATIFNYVLTPYEVSTLARTYNTDAPNLRLTATMSSLSTISMYFAGPANTYVNVDWGDRTNSNVLMTGTTNDIYIPHNYTSIGTYTIKITGNLDQVTQFTVNNMTKISGSLEDITNNLPNLTYLQLVQTNISGSLEDISTLTNLTWLRLNSSPLTGDLANLSTLTNLEGLVLYSTSITGELSDVVGFNNLNTLNLSDTLITGDLADIAELTNLTILNLSSTSITGELSDVINLTNLTYLYLYNTSVSGELSNLAGLTSLVYLRLGSTSVSGDIADIAGLTNLLLLYLYNTSIDTYTSTTLPDWQGTGIQIQNLGLSTTEVDNFLIDLDNATGAPTAGTLSIGGTNAARSSASDAAVLSLDVTKGWAITVNE